MPAPPCASSPAYELPFAGHPTLGSAHVVRALHGGGDDVRLAMRAGVIPVHADGDRWTLSARAPTWRKPQASAAELAAMLGLAACDVAGEPLWVDTGTEQLMIPLVGDDAVRRAKPNPTAMEAVASNGQRAMAYVFARDGNRVLSRFFFPKHGAVIEDPGTGSACANLGGWLLATGAARPVTLVVSQGEAVGRPCTLGLAVDAGAGIHVSGRVVELGRGTIEL